VISRFLENGLRIGIKDRMLSALDQFLVKKVDVGKIEISRHHEIFPRPIALAKIRVAGGRPIRSRSSVPQMPKKNFSTIIEMFLNGLRKFGKGLPSLIEVVQTFVLSSENFGKGLGAGASLAEHKRFSRRHIELHRSDTGSILSTIVLLFHQQKKLIETPKGGPVFFGIMS
jgi:hypothetical protein